MKTHRILLSLAAGALVALPALAQTSGSGTGTGTVGTSGTDTGRTAPGTYDSTTTTEEATTSVNRKRTPRSERSGAVKPSDDMQNRTVTPGTTDPGTGQ